MDTPIHVPESLIQATTKMRGEAGVDWLRRLPALIADMEHRWSLSVGSPFPGIWANWVAQVTLADGTPAVLKISFPRDKEFGTEAEALRVFDGRGICRRIRLDQERDAMLLERCEPGAPLTTVKDDEEATSIAASVLRRLWRPAPPEHSFPLVSDWARGFDRLRRRHDGGTGPMPAALVERAESLFADLIPSQAEPVLLHGDFHHENVLSAEREPWLAIDPKGVVGEPTYDAATLLREPPELAHDPNAGRILERRLDHLSGELGLDRERLRGWALAQSVLAAYWSLEDGGEVWDEALVFARLLSDIRASRTESG
jgi:streptomycin 6-kinase